MKEKQKYEGLIADAQNRIETWLQRAEDTFSFAETAQKRFETGTLEDKRQILSCLGSNLILSNLKLRVQVDKRLELFHDVVPKIKSLQNRLEPVGSIGEWEAITAQTKFWGG